MNKYSILLLLTLGLSAFACVSNSKNSSIKKKIEMEKLPLVTDYKAVKEQSGNKVRLKGIYKEFDVRMRKESPDVLYKGHVAVYLDDDWPVILYPPNDGKAIRPKKERKEMKGKSVVVTGTVYKFIPTGGKGTSLGIPCVLDISDIGGVKVND